MQHKECTVCQPCIFLFFLRRLRCLAAEGAQGVRQFPQAGPPSTPTHVPLTVIVKEVAQQRHRVGPKHFKLQLALRCQPAACAAPRQQKHTISEGVFSSQFQPSLSLHNVCRRHAWQHQGGTCPAHLPDYHTAGVLHSTTQPLTALHLHRHALTCACPAGRQTHL